MMRYSADGIKLTKEFEKCRLSAYPDVKGVPTIGWGHTGPEVFIGLKWTQEQCDQQLVLDSLHAQNAVNSLVHVNLTQEEFDSLVDFVFNIGAGAFQRSTMLRLLNDDQLDFAANEFEKWKYSGGKEIAGLIRRRAAERDEFLRKV